MWCGQAVIAGNRKLFFDSIPCAFAEKRRRRLLEEEEEVKWLKRRLEELDSHLGPRNTIEGCSTREQPQWVSTGSVGPLTVAVFLETGVFQGYE